jgi:hypothetical protein
MSQYTTPNQVASLGLTALTSTIIFVRRVLVLEKTSPFPRTYHFASYCISLTSGLLFWATLNALKRDVLLQLSLGILSTTLSWLVYVLLSNERLMFPSRSQLVSLFFHVVTELSLLFQVRLIV